MRVNSFILSLYPLIFHTCFLIFYWSPSLKVTIITELVCLGVYLLGVIHHIVTLAYEVIIFLAKYIKMSRKERKVTPKNTTDTEPK